LREQVEYLDTRIAKLGEASHSLESGLEQRLSRMASDMVRETRSQFESAANEILEELTAHGDKALGKQLEEVSGSMKSVQSRIVDSVSESLRTQTANTLRDFERSTQELARQSAERWRLKLEGVLNALAKSLSGEFQPEAGGQP
jgi:cell division septum initiation protein DivIVA